MKLYRERVEVANERGDDSTIKWSHWEKMKLYMSKDTRIPEKKKPALIPINTSASVVSTEVVDGINLDPVASILSVASTLPVVKRGRAGKNTTKSTESNASELVPGVQVNSVNPLSVSKSQAESVDNGELLNVKNQLNALKVEVQNLNGKIESILQIIGNTSNNK